MKRQTPRFTLTEMLTVIAIIAILTAIITPTVIIVRQRGQQADAESDITAIMTALKGVSADWNKVFTADYEIGGVTIDTGKVNASTGVVTVDGTAYDAMIAEFSVPKNSGLAKVSVNKRKKTYLDARQDFDPSKSYKDQLENVWRDPYGKPYKILVQSKQNNELKINANKTISANFAVYSFGLDGEDNDGCNLEHRICGDNDCKHDDIASWNF